MKWSDWRASQGGVLGGEVKEPAAAGVTPLWTLVIETLGGVATPMIPHATRDSHA